MNNNFKKAFTLVELIVSTLIGAIVMSFILIFLGDTMDTISEGKNNTKTLIAFSEFSQKLNNYRNLYGSGKILIDNDSSTGSDVFLLKNLNSTDGVIISRIDLDTKKIIEDNTIYKNSPIGFRRVSETEITSLETNIDMVKNYIFKTDKIFYDLVLKDLQAVSYNNGKIFEFEMEINPIFVNDYKGDYWDSLKKDNLLKLNMNF